MLREQDEGLAAATRPQIKTNLIGLKISLKKGLPYLNQVRTSR